jgi:arylsulfatase
MGGRGWDLDAHIERPVGGQGVLYATGTENSGLSLFIQNDRLVFDYNCFGDHHIIESEVLVPVGASIVGVEFRREGSAGRATLVINGAAVGAINLPFAMRILSSIGSSVGFDHGSPVSTRYPKGFAFEGKLTRVDVQLLSAGQAEQIDAARADERAAMARQ